MKKIKLHEGQVLLAVIAAMGLLVWLYAPQQRPRVVHEPIDPTQLSIARVEGKAKLDINRATALLLKDLPGIGTVMSNRIVEYREALGGFDSIEALLNVPGIGEKTLEKLREMVYVG